MRKLRETPAKPSQIEAPANRRADRRQTDSVPVLSSAVEFDYAMLSASARKQIQEETLAIRRLIVNTANNVIQIGLRLHFVHESLGRANFQAWLKMEFGLSQSVASNYMRAAAAFANVDRLEHFQTSALYVLARSKAPAAARAEAIERAGAGEMITKACAEMIIRKYNRKPAFRPAHVANRIFGTLKRLDAQLRLLSPADKQHVTDKLETLLARVKQLGPSSNAAE